MMQATKPKITLAQITRTYNGRPGCACGCRGKYSESQRAFIGALKKYEAAPEALIQTSGGSATGEGERFVFWDSIDGNRTYTIYYKE